jgi:formiminotetrahydrofolate cyclodeaminase
MAKRIDCLPQSFIEFRVAGDREICQKLPAVENAAALLARLVQLEAIAAASMKSDLRVARLMAIAGGNGALANVEINLNGLKDKGYVATMRAKVDELRKRLSA